MDGTLANVDAPTEPLSVEALTLITHRRSYAESANGGIPETREMLDFCAEHNMLPETELVDAPASTRPTSGSSPPTCGTDSYRRQAFA